MHFPMRCLRSDSQRVGRAAVAEVFRGAAEVDERRHGARRKGINKDLIGRRCIRVEAISRKQVDIIHDFGFGMVIAHS